MQVRKPKFEVVPLAAIAPLLRSAAESETIKRPQSPKILSIAKDASLATTRYLLFSNAGFQVTTALTTPDAIQHCRSGEFNLVVIGHSIPSQEKKVLLESIQKRCETPVLALYRRGESQLEGADYALDSSEGPAALLERVTDILKGEPQVT
jgi:DNA-binding response OmpR family regulator